jgi:BlaI family penicillinase repressor
MATDERFRILGSRGLMVGSDPLLRLFGIHLMARPKSNPDPAHRRPTESECNILAAIWDRGSATVREVFDDLSTRQDVGYTTVLKFMQIMTEKGLLDRDTSVRPQIFRASRAKRDVQRDMVGDLLDRAFGGSTESLVLRALSARPSSPEEIAAIRNFLDELEGESK